MAKLGEAIKQRKEFIVIDDSIEYKRCRVQTNRKGVVLRDLVKGSTINTKKQQVCRTGDFIVAEIDAKVGGYGFIPKELDGSIVSSHYFLFELDPRKILKAYLHFLIKTELIQDQINSKGSTNYAAIRPQHVLNFEISLPEIDEQKKIVAKLAAVFQQYDELHNELANQQNHVSQLRQSILREAVQGKLIPQDSNDEPASELLKKIKAEKEKLIAEGKLKKEKPLPPITPEEIPFELPKGWVWCRMWDLAYIGNGSTPDKKEFTNDPKDIPYLKVYNIQKQTVNFDYKPQYIFKSCHEGQLKRSICYSGDVLMNIVGPPLGKVAIVPPEIAECNINQAIVVIRPVFKSLNRWVYWYLCELSAINSIVTKGTAGQDNISVTQSRSLLIPLPPIKEQIRILEAIENHFALCSQLQESITQSQFDAERLLHSVLREAFNGHGSEYKIEETLSLAAEP